MPEREITEPVDLCNPDGTLNRDAVGWTRQPLHRGNLKGWGRTKRWEYWGIVSRKHILGIVVSSLDYAAVHGVYLLDRDKGTERMQDVVVPLARNTTMPERCGDGRVSGFAKDLDIQIDHLPDLTHITVRGREVSADLALPRTGRDSLGVVVPWTDKLFQYTVKDVGRPVTGRITVAGEAYGVAPGSFAVLDHGRGRWPYKIRWNWAAGHQEGLSLNLGGGWTDGTGSTENGIVIGDRLHKISADLEWTYDTRDWLRPWQITGAGVDVGFEPFHERIAKTELGVVGSHTHQCFGHFTGHVEVEGERVAVDGLTGWAEEARQRW
ncbi:MAG: DUF2804 domain-containing protein [Nocardioides sp.]|jgi:hypothetical protein